MFSDYVDEIQNPEHRAETEAYISQLENEDKIPEGKELIRPTVSFVAKVHKQMKEGVKEKIFINIVSSDKIMKPSKEVAKDGTHWSLPYSLGSCIYVHIYMYIYVYIYICIYILYVCIIIY